MTHSLPSCRLVLLWCLWSASLFLSNRPLPAAEEKPADEEGKAGAVARSLTPRATIFGRAKLGEDWRIVKQDDELSSGELLVGLPGAMLESQNHAVRLVFLADLDRLSPYPIREAAAVVHANRRVDLDLTLDRGRVDLVNAKKKGAARVRVRVRNEIWDLTLAKPGASIALELYGRWPAGSTFTAKPGPMDVPHATLAFVVLKGEVVLKHDVHEHTLSAPPGPAAMGWDSITGKDESPHRLDTLPPWAATKDEDTPAAKAKKETLARFRKLVLEKGIGPTLDELIESDTPHERMLAVLAMGAFDQIQRLGKALNTSKHPDVWENGVMVMRHWIGRGPGQEQLLYKALLKTGRFTEVDAETLCQLLHSFGENDLAQPATYQTLIDYLDHEKLGIRGLAYWHLVRLAPDGKGFGYSPGDAPEKREAAIKKWQKLIPRGKLPPKPSAESKE